MRLMQQQLASSKMHFHLLRSPFALKREGEKSGLVCPILLFLLLIPSSSARVSARAHLKSDLHPADEREERSEREEMIE